MTQLVFQHPERTWLAIPLGLIALFLLVRGYRKSPLPPLLRSAAFFCKAAAWALMLLCIVDPLWTRQMPKKGENEVAIIADNGAGLNVAEIANGPTRASAIKQALGQNNADPAWITALADQFRVKTLLADERLRSVANFSALDFSGQRSDVLRSLNQIRDGGSSRALAAIVLISDGNVTDAATAQAATTRKIPIFPILVGNQAPKPDLSIKEVTVSQTAFEDSPVLLGVRCGAEGFAGKEVAVAVIDATNKLLTSEKQKITSNSEQPFVRLRLPNVKPGVSFYRIAIMESSLLAKIAKDEWKTALQEAVVQNNERLAAVDRGTGPYRVLYMAGRPNWEYKFMRRALAGDPEVQIPSLIRIAKREPKFEWRGRAGETSNPLFRGFGAEGAEAQRYDQPVLIRMGIQDAKELTDGFPKAAEDLFGDYRAIIIDDLESEFFSQEQMHLMERFVSERGGALLMLGGQESFQSGKYEHTPVGRMLPVYLDRVSQTSPIQDGRLNLTREGWLEPWLRLRGSQPEDEQRLSSMTGFWAVNQVFSIKPGASILATISDERQNALPALVAQRFGEGRVASLLIGDLWRWGMKDAAARQDLERTWRQLMRWLVVDVPDRIQLSAEAQMEPGQERVHLNVRVRDRAFRPMEEAQVKLTVTDPSGTKSQLFGEPSLKEPGLFEAEYFPHPAGAYQVTAVVEQTSEGKPASTLGTKTTGWAYNPLVNEFQSLTPNRDLMAKLAADSGGQLLTLADLPKLPEILNGIEVPVPQTLSDPLWHTPWFFLLILALLGGEWFLRRKGGMA